MSTDDHIIQIDLSVDPLHESISSECIMSHVRNMYMKSNSPMASHNNSDVEEAGESPRRGGNTIEFHIAPDLPHVPNKLTYEEIERSLSKYYDTNHKYSNEMDILITYLNGQKHVYMVASRITQYKLYAVTFTAVALTTFVSVVSPFIQDKAWNVIIISGCNVIATFLLTLMRYLNFESLGNTYTLMANMYDRLQTSLEISNNKLCFIEKETEQSAIVLEKLKEVEFKACEIKDMCKILLPEEIKFYFPVIYHTNVFSFIKKMEYTRKRLIYKFRDIKNEIQYILSRWNHFQDQVESVQRTKEHRRLLYLMDIKEKTKAELIEYKNIYNQIDELFTKEIRFAESYHFWRVAPKYEIDSLHPMIRDYLRIVYPN